MIANIIKFAIARCVHPVLATRFGREQSRAILDRAFKSQVRNVSEHTESLGGRLMVYCASLTVALYRQLLDEGLDEDLARAATTEVTKAVYDRMAKLPWAVAGLATRSPIVRLRRALNVFRRFPFSAPAFVMEDVPSDDQTVAFDVKRCRVAEHFIAQGLPELCEQSFCNLDFPLAKKWGATLERTTTIARGADRCDFRWRVCSSGNT